MRTFDQGERLVGCRDDSLLQRLEIADRALVRRRRGRTDGLPEDIEARLEALAKKTGRTKRYCAREAIVEYIDDQEDLYLAQKRFALIVVVRIGHPREVYRG